MTQQRFYTSNALPTTLTASLGATGNPQVASITGLPVQYPFTVIVDWGNLSQEAVSVTSAPTGSGPFTLPCTRGIDGTTAQSHLLGAVAVHGVTAEDYTQWSAFIDDLTGTAASNFLATLTPVAVTISGTLAVNTKTSVTAATALTMTLPSPTAGALVVVEREAASTATVSVTGNVRGVPSTTLALVLPSESEAFLGTGSTWEPIAGHKTLGSLDGRYGQVFSPVAYGAAGNGTTDDTTAVLAAFSAAATAHGIVDLGFSRFLTSSAIPVYTGMHVRGATPIGSGSGGGGIVNSTTALFTFAAATLSNITFENCLLSATGTGSGGGHVWDATAGPLLSFLRILGVAATQTGTGYGIWSQAGGHYIDCLVDAKCNFTMSASATVPGWQSLQCDNTSAAWQNSRTNAGNNPNVPFYNFDWQTVAGISHDTVFRNLTFEQSPMGLIHMTGAFAVTIENVRGWDVPGVSGSTGGYLGNVFSFSKSAFGDPCRNITIRNSGQQSGIQAAGVFDVFADAFTTNLVLDTVGDWAVPPVLSVPAAQTTITNCSSNHGADSTTFPAVAVAGQTGATAASMYAGATTGGAPVTGTFALGNWVIDQAGGMWVCTAAGTPGTWAPVGSASFVPTQVAYFTSNGTWTKPAGAVAVQVTLLGGGAGGGSGAAQASGTASGGGGGGGGGGIASRMFNAADLASTVSVGVGAGGTGAAAVSTNSTSGNVGGSGGGSTFGSYFATLAAIGGAAGTTAGGGGGTAGGGTVVASNGGTSSVTAAGAPSNPTGAAAGGGAGGGISTGGTAFAGGKGNFSYMGNGSNTGTAGVVGGAAPTAGTSPTATGTPSCGGGGGAAALTGTAQSGAAAFFGGGGGGGGATQNGGTSGAGGNGGAGFVMVITYF